MTLFVYNVIWRLIRPFIPLILWHRTRKGKELASRRIERFGRTDTKVKRLSPHSGRRIWLHGVSVGETVAALRLARCQLRKWLANRLYQCVGRWTDIGEPADGTD